MFVDASALAAILLEEPDGKSLAEQIERADRQARMTSPLAVFEAVLAVARRRAGGSARARSVVSKFLHGAGIRIAAIDEQTGTLSLDAHALFGKGSGHPARLNLGDCFAYAMAKQHGVPLLYKGGDFAQTDLA